MEENGTVPPRYHEPSIKMLNDWYEIPLLELLVSWIPQSPYPYHTYFTGFPLGLDDNHLLLETTGTFVGHGKISLVLTWKLHSCWLAFRVLGSAMCATWGEEKSANAVKTIVTSLAKAYSLVK